MDRQNEQLLTELGDMNSKIDSLFTSINELKLDNERLRNDNELLKTEIFQVKNKLDALENQSRRNNLGLNGIQGDISESWYTSEKMIRSFLKHTLNLHELANSRN